MSLAEMAYYEKLDREAKQAEIRKTIPNDGVWRATYVNNPGQLEVSVNPTNFGYRFPMPTSLAEEFVAFKNALKEADDE